MTRNKNNNFYNIIANAKKRMKHLKCNNCNKYRRPFKTNLPKCVCSEEDFKCHYHPSEWYEYISQ